MERKLLKKIRFYLIVLELIVMLALISALYMETKQNIFAGMEQLLSQEEEFYLSAMGYQEDMLTHYADDFMAKLSFASHILEDHWEISTTAEMQEMRDWLDLEDIYVFDNDGAIVLSSDADALGERLLANEQALLFERVMWLENENFCMSLASQEILSHRPGQDYAAMKTTASGYSMILAAINKSDAQMLVEEGTPAGIVRRIPTAKNESLYVLDGQTYRVLGASEDNEPALDLNSLDLTELSLEKMATRGSGAFWGADYFPVFYQAKAVDNVILLELRRPVREIRMAMWLLLGIILTLTMVTVLIVVQIRRFFRKYVFNEVAAIQRGIQEMIEGHEDVQFQTGDDPEFALITKALTQWNNSIQQTQKKMNWFSATDHKNMAVFEYLAFVNMAYWSDNLKAMLGLDDQFWDSLKDDPAAFKEFCIDLAATQNDHGIVELNGKYLNVDLYQTGENLMGFVTDQTQAVVLKKAQALALEKAKMDSETDSLTGLMNRRGFELRFQQNMEKDSGSTVMLMIDVDNFKVVNDTLGHPVGDKVLQAIARVLQAQSGSDCVARLGGDEFAVIFPGMSVEALEAKLDYIMEAMRKLQKKLHIPFTISTGAALLNGKCKSFEELYRSADEALYDAKRAGKNRYVIHIIY